MLQPLASDDRLQPFDLGEGAASALLIHGFTGSPFEMRYLGEHLAQRGLRAVGVRLPGHGLDPYELEAANAMEWINTAREALLSLPAQRRTFVVGLSMGSLIGAVLAADHPARVDGLVLCAPPLRLRARQATLLGLSSLGLLTSTVRFIEKRPPVFADPSLYSTMPRLDRIPTRAAAEFERVRALARLALPKISAPAMVIYSEADRTVSPAAAQECARRIGSRPVRQVKLERSSHVLTVDVERERVAGEVERFLRGLLP